MSLGPVPEIQPRPEIGPAPPDSASRPSKGIQASPSKRRTLVSLRVQISVGELAQTPMRSSVVPLSSPDHPLASRWTRPPPSPAAYTSSGPLPQMARRSRVVGASSGLHSTPSKCTSAPRSPTAKTSVLALPQISFSPPEGLDTSRQVVPSHWKKPSPAELTTHMSVYELAQSARPWIESPVAPTGAQAWTRERTPPGETRMKRSSDVPQMSCNESGSLLSATGCSATQPKRMQGSALRPLQSAAHPRRPASNPCEKQLSLSEGSKSVGSHRSKVRSRAPSPQYPEQPDESIMQSAPQTTSPR